MGGDELSRVTYLRASPFLCQGRVSAFANGAEIPPQGRNDKGWGGFYPVDRPGASPFLPDTGLVVAPTAPRFLDYARNDNTGTSSHPKSHLQAAPAGVTRGAASL